MEGQLLNVRSVAVIGAGISGVSAAIHLKRAGLDVRLYERSRRAGGIWVFDENVAKDASYPSTLPSVGDSPEYERLARLYRRGSRQDSPLNDLDNRHLKTNEQQEKISSDLDLRTSFAPPGPCYQALRNNVSTIEMEITAQKWKPDTEEFVPHHVLADYIQDSAIGNGLLDVTSFDTRVNDVRKVGKRWQVAIDHLIDGDERPLIESSIEESDAVVVATGHYHACNVPDVPGLADWKHHFPRKVQHSKCYRSSERFRGKNVLLIGAGVSSMDIARDLGSVARSVYQSSRGGPYDLPSHMLPNNAAQIGAIKSFEALQNTESAEDGSIPGAVTLISGEKICGIHEVIVCTGNEPTRETVPLSRPRADSVVSGYHVSFPFMREYHRDGLTDATADETCLSVSGQQTHNLHKDIWYIPDPTLAFVGAPYHVATFSCFEFQGMAIAAVFARRTTLPSTERMREEYVKRLQRKGAGRTFHSLKVLGEEVGYVNELVDLVENGRVKGGDTPLMTGHTERWHEAYARRVAGGKILFSQQRDPKLDQAVLDLVIPC